MKLTDLTPRWVGAMNGRTGIGLSFDCPNGETCPCGGMVFVPFENPIDGGEAVGQGPHWRRIGTEFDTLTLHPSIDGSHFGCWHGWVRNGEVTGT